MIEQPTQPLLITLSVRLYAALLVLYPSAFRADYGAHIVQVFHDVSRDCYRRQGVAGIVVWWCSALLDLIVTAIEQRKKGKTAMSTVLSMRQVKGSGLGIMTIMGGLIYIVGGLWLSISGMPTDLFGVQLTHLLRMMWAGGVACGVMGMTITGAISEGQAIRTAAWASFIGLVIIEIDALVALVVHSPASSFSGLPMPFATIGQALLLPAWVVLSIVIVNEQRWTGWTRFAPLIVLLSPFVGVLLGGLLGVAFLSVVIMGMGLLMLGIAVQTHLDNKRRAMIGMSPVVSKQP